MNSDQEKFEALRKLMALKRHEQPPPEYLSELTETIITRIELGEGRRNLWDKLSAKLTLRPGLAYAFGLTVCGALGFSGVYMIKQQVAESTDPASGMIARGQAPAETFASQNIPAAGQLHVANWLRNTNPASETQPELSLFTTSHSVIPVAYEAGH